MKSFSANSRIEHRLVSLGRGTVAPLLLAVTLAWPAAPVQRAQKEPPKPIQVATNLVLVEVTVKYKQGPVVNDLTKDDFGISDDGSPQTIAHFSRGELPLAVALVVDLSASIYLYVDELRRALRSSLETLKPEDEVALFTFATRVQRRVELTRDKSAVAGAFNNLVIGGSTNINDALYDAAQYLGDQAPSARRVILLVSDNVASEQGTVSPKQVESEILKADAALYSLKIPGSNSHVTHSYIEMSAPALVNVEKVVPRTGGEIFDVGKESTLSASFAALLARLRARYTLGFAPDHSAQDGRFHTLAIRLKPGVCDACTLVTKRSYYAAPAPAAAP